MAGAIITADGAADWAVDAAGEQADNLRTPPDVLLHPPRDRQQRDHDDRQSHDEQLLSKPFTA